MSYVNQINQFRPIMASAYTVQPHLDHHACVPECDINLSVRRENAGVVVGLSVRPLIFYLPRFDLFKLTASLSHQKGSACKSRNHGDRLPDQGDVVPATVLLLYRLRGP